MGQAQGTALRDRILTADSIIGEIETFRLRQPRWMPYPLFRRLAERKSLRSLQPALAEQCPEMADRLEAMASAAGVRLETLYLMNALESVMSSTNEFSVIPPLGGCSAVAVRGSRSATGEPMIAHNFDYLPLVQPLYSIRNSRPANGFRSLDFTVAPLAGTVDGINDHGLCVTYNYAHVVDVTAPAAPISMLISETLAKCETVAQAADWLCTRPHWGAGILMLADATGDIASLELSNTRAHLRRPAAGEDVLYHSNTFNSDEMRSVEIDPRAVYTDAAPKPLRGLRVLGSPQKRVARLKELVPQTAKFGSRELAGLMADHGPEDCPSADTLCMHGDYWFTTACVQLLPSARKMRVAYNSACRAEYVDFNLDA